MKKITTYTDINGFHKYWGKASRILWIFYRYTNHPRRYGIRAFFRKLKRNIYFRRYEKVHRYRYKSFF